MLSRRERLLLSLIWGQWISNVYAAITWPSPVYDELEDLMVLTSGYGNRNFMAPLVPCTFAPNPGHSVAGGFLRVAFHDMAGANVAEGTDGLDASIGFELDSSVFPENTGPAFNNTLSFVSRFYSSRASMSDLLALAAYASVRACGGPAIPLKAGRIDATQAGTPGVPDPKDDIDKLNTEFARMGLTPEEGIQLVACGHTLGGVHSAEHPTIVPAGTTSLGVQDFDATNSTFDNSTLTMYLDSTTLNPLVVGPDVDSRSDLRLFNSDGNKTVSSMVDSYDSTCSVILGKMLDTVPASVTLTEVITAYPVKPANLALTISNADQLVFSGAIRFWTNKVSKLSVSSLQLVYKDRIGAPAGAIDASVALGDGTGFDDSFTFYGFNASIPAKTSISSFVVKVSLTSGSTVTYDNNGKGFPVQDTILSQNGYSSLAAADASGSQQATIIAAVRSGTEGEVDLTVDLINAMGVNNLPTISKIPTAMTKVCESLYYDFYSASFGVPAAAVNGTKYDLSVGGEYDGFKGLIGLQAQAARLPCGRGSSSTTSSATTSSSSRTKLATSTTTASYISTTTASYISTTNTIPIKHVKSNSSPFWSNFTTTKTTPVDQVKSTPSPIWSDWTISTSSSEPVSPETTTSTNESVSWVSGDHGRIPTSGSVPVAAFSSIPAGGSSSSSSPVSPAVATFTGTGNALTGSGIVSIFAVALGVLLLL
ncbi:hypothetical protein AYL99_02110 [Fonsecaea erecta]|uniref:Peroxidase n=1 Tax=Fonsecaea erecta TaxID=1367422 RepID=A0A178ZUI2_9EURO|nr:hypothetical protein AYL99_02110 [Fonsecaea erecta]OAP62883.1 hypothetical protein AYL99_02110 [Fonsecaea erecta]